MNSDEKLIDIIMNQLNRLEEKQEEVYKKLTDRFLPGTCQFVWD